MNLCCTTYGNSCGLFPSEHTLTVSVSADGNCTHLIHRELWIPTQVCFEWAKNIRNLFDREMWRNLMLTVCNQKVLYLKARILHFYNKNVMQSAIKLALKENRIEPFLHQLYSSIKNLNTGPAKP